MTLCLLAGTNAAAIILVCVAEGERVIFSVQLLSEKIAARENVGKHWVKAESL